MKRSSVKQWNGEYAMNRMCYMLLAMAVVLVGFTFLGGCDTVQAPHAGRVDQLPIDDYPKVSVAKKLHRHLRLSPPEVEQGSHDRPMRVTVPVRSLLDRRSINVQYRFEFFDEVGRPIDRQSEHGWRLKELTPRIQTFFDGNALDVNAADWRLTIRSAQ